MLASLGLFVFGLDTLPHQQLQRQRQWRHNGSARTGQRPDYQYLGPGDETLTLQGVLLPSITGGSVNLTAISAMADSGQAWPLLLGTGEVMGLYVIESLNETRSLLFADGAARKIEFSIGLKRIADDRIDLLGDLSSLALGAVGALRGGVL